MNTRKPSPFETLESQIREEQRDPYRGTLHPELTMLRLNEVARLALDGFEYDLGQDTRPLEHKP